MASLDEVLASGQGIERPFRCTEHDDHEASASVNVLKGVWYCFACGAKGKTDGKGKPPSVAELEAMLNPEAGCRIYPESYLTLFSTLRGHWNTRFPDWLAWFVGMGHDPLTSDAIFPVRTPKGLLAGVGRRLAVIDPARPKMRYAYPPRWSAASTMFRAGMPQDIMVLVEGAGDATATAETGAYACACYGSALHYPQIELVRRSAPKLVILGQDADEAGYKGAVAAEKALRDDVEIAYVDWSELDGKSKDPAELPVEVRFELLMKTVRGTRYGSALDTEILWSTTVDRMKERFLNREQ